jgi:Reverse transcriptase (RNA-dependent DNA polymerase)
LISLIDIICVIYLDDILIFLENLTKHTKIVQGILEKLKENKLFANLKKYDFGINTIEFLGFIVGSNGTRIDLLCVQVIKD